MRRCEKRQAQSYFSCLKPWAIPDKWIDRHDDPNDGVWTADDTFESVDGQGNPLGDADVYAHISTNPAGTGFQLPRDLGLLVTLKIADPQDGMKSGYFYAINLGTAGDGASAYRSAIATCQDPVPPHFGDILQPLTGNLKGPTVQGVADLINLDPKAEWDAVTKTVINSCAPSVACGPVSPRIVTVLDSTRCGTSEAGGTAGSQYSWPRTSSASSSMAWSEAESPATSRHHVG